MLNNTPIKRTRYAIYTRYSSEMQNEISLEAQEALCREAIAERGGAVVAVYSDSAKSGWSLERDGFIEMRRAAEHGKFDAMMFWKFDRLARNHEHVVMIKMLLRHEYGLKLYCVEGFSEDDNDSPYSAMMEQLLAVISAFYSKNLSNETKRGKHYRAVSGEFNGSVPPLGYNLMTTAGGTTECPPGLHVNPRLAVLVRQAFKLYATGNYSDRDIAEWLNLQPLIQQFREGQKPIGKEMIRDMLKNRVYTGRVPYCETLYSGSLGEGKRSNRHRKEWFEGKHQGFISDTLFDQCQEIRVQLTKHRKPFSQMQTYSLNDRVYCARCVARKPNDLKDRKYGKMRAAYSQRDGYAAYRCLCRDRGYGNCEQGYVTVQVIDEQVVQTIANLTIPDDLKTRVEHAIQNQVEHAESLKRMEEIKEIVQRINFSWEKGFMTPDEYIEKRTQLQREMEALRPVMYDDLMEAADLLSNFTAYWQQCGQLDNPEEARKQLLTKIVDRVFVYDQQVIAVALHGDYGVILDTDLSIPAEVLEEVSGEITKSGNITTNVSTQSGSDGI
jgi:site-specific DNA recombinase